MTADSKVVTDIPYLLLPPSIADFLYSQHLCQTRWFSWWGLILENLNPSDHLLVRLGLLWLHLHLKLNMVKSKDAKMDQLSDKSILHAPIM